MIYTEERPNGQLVVDLDEPAMHNVKDQIWLEYHVQYRLEDGYRVRSIWVERTEPNDTVISEARYWANRIDTERGAA